MSDKRITAHLGGYEIPYDLLRFSGGEVHVRLNITRFAGGHVRLHARVQSPDDVLTLLMLTDAVRRAGANSVALAMPYVPYARQDRVCAPGEALSLRVFCDLINAQQYDQVTIVDPHSDVTGALLDRCTIVGVETVLASAMASIDSSRVVLVAPDAGALKKVERAAKRLEAPYMRADKSRDPKTGAITDTTFYGEHIGDRDFLIVDDICDGGRTFVELAAELRPFTTGRVMLYVTHGIFSRGAAVFDGLIDKVFVANCFIDKQSLPSNFVVLDDILERL